MAREVREHHGRKEHHVVRWAASGGVAGLDTLDRWQIVL
jgi:hypothetical protein